MIEADGLLATSDELLQLALLLGEGQLRDAQEVLQLWQHGRQRIERQRESMIHLFLLDREIEADDGR